MKKVIRDNTISHSFQARHDIVPQNHNVWHFHEELEFIYIHEGSGTFFIGDRIKPFEHGACVLIGKNVPHYWLFNDEYLNEKEADVYVILFKENFAGQDFLYLPELARLKRLFDRSQKGLFSKRIEASLVTLFKDVMAAEHSIRIITLLQALHLFEESADKTELISTNYTLHHHDEDFNRMNTIMSFLMENFRQEVDLKTLADRSGMAKNSFCRYFKQKTGKTLTEFVTELKIAHSCKLLRTGQYSVKTCCYESGFNNLVSFHKAFHRIVGSTPKIYKSTYINDTHPES